MINNYNRKLSDNEFVYVKFSNFCGQFVQLMLECEKGIDIKKLDIAIRKLQDLLPETKLIIENGKFSISDCHIKITDLLCHKFNGFNFEVLPFFNSKTDLAKLIEIYRIAAHANDYLLFRIHHSLMDGQGALIFISLLFDIMNDRELFLPNTFESDEIFCRSLKTHKKSLDLRFKNKLIKQPHTTERGLVIKRTNLKGNTNGILAKVINIIKNYYLNDDLTFLIPSSIRRYAPEKKNMGNLTLPLYLNCKKSDSWDSTYKKLYLAFKNDEILNTKNIKYDFVLKISDFFFNTAIKTIKLFQKLTGRYLTGGKITNLGIVDLNKLTAESLKVISIFDIPVYNPLFPLAVSIVENEFYTEIVAISDRQTISAELLEKITADITALRL